MPKKSRIGTKDDPIQVIQENCERDALWPLLNEQFYESKTYKRSEILAMIKEGQEIPKNWGVNTSHWADSSRDFYINNVLYNHVLTLTEVKIALYFYHLLIAGRKKPEYDGTVCIVRSSENDVNVLKWYGDGDGEGIWIADSYHGQKIYEYHKSAYTRLYDVCRKMIPNATTKVITDTLANLHNHGYLIVTDIVTENQRSYRLKSGENYTEDGKQKPRRPRLKHVRICRWMIHTKIWDKFK